MTKSVSNIVTASTVVAVAATAINQAEALNDRQHNRLRALQEEGEDASASTSLSMLTNVESISTLINDEEPKFQEKKKEMDIGILMSSVMSKNSELTDKVSQALDQMEDWDKQELGGKVNDLVDLVKHLLPRGKSGKSKSGKGSKASGDDEEPSSQPSAQPSSQPSSQPSNVPSASAEPSSQPSSNPTSSGIPSLMPSESPSLSSQPSSQPSNVPSASAEPSSSPSVEPSLSSAPSSMPSMRPSLSSQPSSQPSLKPSTSSAPSCSIIRERVPNPCTDTGEPYLIGAIVRLYVDRIFVAQNVTDEDGYYEFHCYSGVYRVEVDEPDCPSLMPSTQHSVAPSISSGPSHKPSESPSLSSNPSSNPSQSPSSNLSQSPSISSKPTCEVIRDRVQHPCDESSSLVGAEVTLLYDRIEFKTVTDQDGYYEFSCLSLTGDYEIRVELPDCTTFQPSLHPTVSSLPSTQASDLPSLSTIPSSQPSQRPSAMDTEAPSISSSPTSQPSVSIQSPSSIPSALPSLSTKPTLGNTQNPSSSKVPSSTPSQIPTYSQLPSSILSTAPSLTSKPSLGRTQRPSTSTPPSTHPSATPSLSRFPSSSPSDVPSNVVVVVSSVPSSSPSQSPSISSKPTCNVIRDRVIDPCDGSSFLVGAEVTLLYDRIEFKTVTDQDGYYEFSCLSLTGDYEISVEVPDCVTLRPSSQPTETNSNVPSSWSSSKPSNVISMQPSMSKSPSSMPSILPSTSSKPSLRGVPVPTSMPSSTPSTTSSNLPSSQPSEPTTVLNQNNILSEAPTVTGMVIQRQAFDPCASGVVPLQGATVLLYQSGSTEIFKNTTTDSDGWYEFRGLPMSRYDVEIDYPDCSSRRDLVEKIGQQHIKMFRESGDFCASFDDYERHSSDGFTTHFSSLDECCANIFWYDMEGCIARSHVADFQPLTEEEVLSLEFSSVVSDVPRFYPTFISGQLCHSKKSFDAWEESHDTLKECCQTHFSWDYEECMKNGR